VQKRHHGVCNDYSSILDIGRVAVGSAVVPNGVIGVVLQEVRILSILQWRFSSIYSNTMWSLGLFLFRNGESKAAVSAGEKEIVEGGRRS